MNKAPTISIERGLEILQELRANNPHLSDQDIALVWDGILEIEAQILKSLEEKHKKDGES